MNRYRLVEGSNRAVRQANVRHVNSKQGVISLRRVKKKSGLSRSFFAWYNPQGSASVRMSGCGSSPVFHLG
ncbi:hypothetical protein DLM_2406 [Aquitalea magnusonii]|uniref:Uncharacterized protein n=1 Tax=Aquitalea magnusonii TaxID=332411 RepID=A0A3G9GL27_9NEIS|nr:hypothetical protein DLM_2406 [Aquitalea magnusonii]